MSRAKSSVAKKKAPAEVPEKLKVEETKKVSATEAKVAASPAKPTKKRAASAGPSKTESKPAPAPAESAPSPAKKQKPTAKASKPKAEPVAADDAKDASPAQPRKRKQPSRGADADGSAESPPEAKPVSPAPTKKAKQKAKSPAPKKQPVKKAAAKETEADGEDEPQTNGDEAVEAKAPAKAARGKGKKAAATEAQAVADALFEDESDSEFEGLEDEDDAESKQVALSDAQLSELASLGKAKALAVKGRLNESTKSAGRGVIYLGHIPHGFFEDQMRGFFTQFGTITRLRLSRSKKTGRSRGYAFIEFETPEVAEIVADTMNGYMMFGRSLKCHVVRPDQLHADTFKGANKKFRRVPWARLAREQMNKSRTPEQQKKRVARLQKKDDERRAKLAALGIDYKFEGYSQIKPKADEETDKKAAVTKSSADAKPKTKPAKAKKTA